MRLQYFRMKSKNFQEMLKFCSLEDAIVEIQTDGDNPSSAPFSVSIEIPFKKIPQNQWIDFQFKLAKQLQSR